MPQFLYPADLFESTSMRSIEQVEHVLEEFHWTINPKNFHNVLHEIITSEKENILPLVLANVAHDSALHSWILDSFPSSAVNFSSSLPSLILQNLSKYFLIYPPPSGSAISAQLHETVCHASTLLSVIPSMTFPTSLNGPDRTNETRKQSQRARKDVKKSRARLQSVDLRPFGALGFDVPSNVQEAEALVHKVLQIQKSHLELHLACLRTQEVRDSLVSGAVVLCEPERTLSIHIGPVVDSVVSPVSVECSSSFPPVQPMKSAFYFDSIDGFGEWTILISNNADARLRNTRKKEQKTFDIIVKKIKELSTGHFSDDNQKKLAGHQTDVPVYEAKMTGDARLIYQIDCIPYDDEHEQQAIKIFDICTHAQMDARLWESVNRQMIRKGSEYRSRCSFRDMVGKNTFRPGLFPPLPETASLSAMLPEIQLDEVFSKQAHSRLVMDKFVAFSKPLLNAMLADIDLTFPHLVSFKEKKIIEHSGPCYVLGRSGTGKTTTMLFKMLLVERTHQIAGTAGSKPRQVFVTQSRVLAKKVKHYFDTLLDALKTASLSVEEMSKRRIVNPKLLDRDLIHEDDDTEHGVRFSDLQEEHFPLITTVDQLWSMIEADMTVDDLRTPVTPIGGNEKRQLLTYKIFLREYWPHFSQALTKRLDPALVFAQLLGIIKGSEATLTGESCFLSLDQYEHFSERAESTFVGHRQRIYEIFEAYQKLKLARRERDAADRTHTIIAFIKSQKAPFHQHKIDRLYVDEVQDNLLIDTLILRALCRDGDSLFWAGDTAQTISVGSSFRFDDLKAFQYRLEDAKKFNRAEKKTQPELFQLCINYRSHAGIVDCAHSIIELITKFWPDSIDRLERESGVADGSKPVFFTGWDEDSVQLEQFLFGESGNPIEFGAQQCIIVRTEEARESLQKQFGDIGLVMTIYESKGLEFNDVLLYNFFQDSEVEDSQWRIILQALPDNANAPGFDEIRHASICTELKFLYVAVTRARENVWIADCSQKGQPMREFWTYRRLVDNFTPGIDVPQLATSSTKEEWAEMGQYLFDNDKYPQAERCFLRASLPDRAAVAHAFYLRAKAESIPEKKIPERKRAFVQAGEAFLSCAQENTTKERTTLFVRSGECFFVGGESSKAAEAFVHGRKYEKAAEIYRDLRLFDEAVELVKNHQVQSRVYESVIGQARLFYFARKKLYNAIALFGSFDEGLQYLEERDLDDVRALLLESAGRIQEAAELHLAEGRVLKAILLFLKDKDNQDSMQSANKWIVHALWQIISFGFRREDLQSDPLVSSLLSAADQLRLDMVKASDYEEIVMFRAIVANQTTDLRQLGESFHYQKKFSAALLCLDYYHSEPSRLSVMDASQLADELQSFLVYVRLLSEVLKGDPFGDPEINRLFAIHSVGENQFNVTSKSFIGSRASHHTSDTSDIITLTAPDVWLTLQTSIKDRLRFRITQHIDATRDATSAFSPCESFVVFRSCHRVRCPKNHLVVPLSSEMYNARVRIHLQEIIICQHLQIIGNIPVEEIRRQQKYRLHRLYDALYPPHHLLGTFSNLDFKLIPEAERSFQIMKEWVRCFIYELTFHPETPFLTEFIRCTTLALRFDEKAATDYMNKSKCMFPPRPERYIRPDTRSYIIVEMLNALKGVTARCLISGMFAVKHILELRLPINVSVLCDFIDFLCARLAASNRMQYHRSLHGLTLPRSWFLQHIKFDEKTLRNWDSQQFVTLVRPMSNLLEQMYTGKDADYLLFGGNHNLQNLPIPVRNIFVGRICRALGILGYNIQSPLLRGEILGTLRSLRQKDPTRRFLSIYAHSNFLSAESWNDVVFATRRSISGTCLDEFIELLDSKHLSNQRKPLKGVQPLQYVTLEEITAVLGSSILSVEPNDEVLDSPGSLMLSSAGATDEIREEREEEIANTDVPDTETLPESEAVLDSDMPLLVSSELTEQQREAAHTIIKAIKKYISKRERGSRADARTRLFLACMKEVENVSKGSYLLLFRGPLPHILFCLDVLKIDMHKYKQLLKAQLKDMTGDIDGWDKKLTQASKIFNEILRLQKALQVSPSIAPVHQEGNAPELKRLVKQVRDITKELPISTSQLISRDCELGYKGIVAVAKPKKETKPSLNTSDLY